MNFQKKRKKKQYGGQNHYSGQNQYGDGGQPIYDLLSKCEFDDRIC
jgi:hypothetical protein